MKYPIALTRAMPCALALVVFASCPPTLIPGQTRTFDGIQFQWCPPGTFMMGSPASEAGREMDETLHQVTISRGFWLGKYEVTQAQWESIMGANPSLSVGDDRPVERISRDDAEQFIAALNAGSSSPRYRLPNEAEWEYAYRAGTSTRFFWGNDSMETEIDDYAWYTGNYDLGGTEPVGVRQSNGWGLYDIAGNVAEFCQDWYGVYPMEPVRDPQGPDIGDLAIVRGGWFLSFPYQCRGAYRFTHSPDTPSFTTGLRLLRTAN